MLYPVGRINGWIIYLSGVCTLFVSDKWAVQSLNPWNEQVVQAPRFLFLYEITKNKNIWLVGS